MNCTHGCEIAVENIRDIGHRQAKSAILLLTVSDTMAADEQKFKVQINAVISSITSMLKTSVLKFLFSF